MFLQQTIGNIRGIEGCSWGAAWDGFLHDALQEHLCPPFTACTDRSRCCCASCRSPATTGSPVRRTRVTVRMAAAVSSSVPSPSSSPWQVAPSSLSMTEGSGRLSVRIRGPICSGGHSVEYNTNASWFRLPCFGRLCRPRLLHNVLEVQAAAQLN